MDKMKSRQMLYYERNRERILLTRRERYQLNKEKQAQYDRRYYLKNRESRKEYAKQYRKENRKKLASYCRERFKTDIQYRMRRLLRSRLKRAIGNNCKTGSAIKDLGCSLAELKVYLESQFTLGMSWEKLGEIHIDHKVPLSSFDLMDRSQYLRAAHYTNLQPLWARDNLKKGAQIL